MKSLSIIAFVMLFSIAGVRAETIKGRVFGENDGQERVPLAKATVQWMNSNVGAFSDVDGFFRLERPRESRMLIVSYVGYKTDTVHIDANRDEIEIVLSAGAELKQVNVTDSKPGLILGNTVGQTETITGHGLRKAACCNLSESFQTNASVDVSYADAVSGAKRIELLGLAHTYNLLLTEKLPQLRGLAGIFGMNYIPGTWMESIQIAKGAASVESGYESISGQINVEYKKPSEYEPLFLNLYANDKGAIDANANSSWMLSEEFGGTLFLHGTYMNTRHDGNSDGFLDMPLTKNFILMNRWKYFSDIWRFQFGVKALTEERRNGQDVFFDDERDSYGMEINSDRYEVFAKTGIVFPTEKFHSVAVLASASSHDHRSFFGDNKFNAKEKTAFVNLLYHTSVEQIRKRKSEDGHIHSEKIDAHKFSLGASFNFDEFDGTYNDSLLYRKEAVPGIFGEYVFSAIENLQIITGLRYDFHNEYGAFFTPRVHVRRQFGENLTLRASVGKGFRVVNLFAENTGYMASSREYIIEEDFQPEEAWNYGANATWNVELFGKLFTFNAEFYRTEFLNQVVVDLDRNPRQVAFYNLDGESYSNSFQIDGNFKPISNLTLTAAYRLNDVKTTYDGELRRQPLKSVHKGFVNGEYRTDYGEWSFDGTLEYSGGGRLPDTDANPERYRLDDEFDGFFQLHGQITRNFDLISLYVGAENILDFRQENPIVAADDPFGEYFDASMIWGPLDGRKIYAGIRLYL